MLRFEEALAKILALASPTTLETARLEGADGRVLGTDVVAPTDLPAAEMRGGDGYAPTARIQRGEELVAGAVAITKGTRLRPAHLALAHALGYRELPVHARPAVAIVSDASIAVALRASAERAGARARVFEEDEAEAAFAWADVVVTSPAMARASGGSFETWRVAIKPGAVVGVGKTSRAIVLAPSDNPASALVAFALFGVPLLRAMQGDAHPFPAFARARLTRAHAHDPGLLELARASLGQAEHGYTVTTLGGQPGGGILSMARADALVCITEEANGVHAGDEVDILLMSDLAG